ncbi:MAG: hypothetical protein K940chlam3_01415, partial [Chlamydiae bacterium]|nr:hypothetical protein [Chlamydiota bacterium]
MNKINGKRGLDEVSPTEGGSKRQRTNPDEERVQELADSAFGPGNDTIPDVAVNILSYLTPKVFSRMGEVSKTFYDFTRNDYDSYGVETKCLIAKNGYPTYLLKVFCEGDGCYSYLNTYLQLIEECESDDKRNLLISLFMRKLP